MSAFFPTSPRPGRASELKDAQKPDHVSLNTAISGLKEGRWREELIQRDKINLDIFWLRDESLEDSDSFPEPDVLAQEITENLEVALDQFASVSRELGET